MTSLTPPERALTAEFNFSEEHQKILSQACSVVDQLFKEIRPARIRIEITADCCGDCSSGWNVFVTDYADPPTAPPAPKTGGPT
jgi:hypothetical protein